MAHVEIVARGEAREATLLLHLGSEEHESSLIWAPEDHLMCSEPKPPERTRENE